MVKAEDPLSCFSSTLYDSQHSASALLSASLSKCLLELRAFTGRLFIPLLVLTGLNDFLLLFPLFLH